MRIRRRSLLPRVMECACSPSQVYSLAQCCEPSRAVKAVSEHDVVGSQCRTSSRTGVASNTMLLHLRKQLQVEAGR